MYLFGQETGYVLIECEKCGRVLKFDKQYFVTVSEENCISTIPLQCKCGNKSENPIVKKPPDIKPPSRPTPVSTEIHCPKCGSTQITANKKGFGLGKAAAGGILLGPVGLMGGLLGSNKVILTCLKCGHQFKPGQGK